MTTEKQLHVVLGAGPLGQAAAAALLARGHRVKVVTRGGAGDLPAGAEAARADAYDSRQVEAASAGAAAVYQCAQPHYHEWVEQFPPLQRSIVEGVARSGAKLIVAENLYMYGAVEGPIHEGLPYAAHTRKGRVRARMAEELLAAHRAGTVRAAAARASDFYGPGVRDSALGDFIFGRLLAGKAAQGWGNVDAPHSFTYIGDFGEALAVLGERDEALGQAWHVPSAPAISTRAVVERFAALAGVAPRITGVGRLLMSLVGLFNPGARETVEMLYEFEGPFLLDASRFAAAFGDIHTPLDTGLARTLAWYRGAAPAPAPAH